jgi:hypothetical protein
MNDKTIVTQTLTDAVLHLASLGFFLLPLHAPAGNGACSCGHATCGSKAKHPRTPGGSKDATRDPESLRVLFGVLYRNANTGIATGEGAGIVVLDVDPRHGGDRALMELEAKHGELPLTPSSTTGGGGLHFFFKHPGGIIKNSVSKVGPGLDIRGAGGYVVAPPSIHISGQLYSWIIGRSPSDVPLALPPAWLIQEMQGGDDLARSVVSRARARRLVKHGVCEGERNTAIAQLVGHLLRHRVDPFIAQDLVLAWNITRNTPPLPEAEVAMVIDSIAGREKSRRGGRRG